MQYIKNPSVIFISMAVSDTKKDWIRAITQDKPIWLQLFDENKKAQTGYAAFEIPRFVIIDKKGKIVSYDAPPPSKESDLVKILEQEIRK